MAGVGRTGSVAAGIFLASILLSAQVAELGATHVFYDGADWKLKGQGVVCCPCAVPCPCRSNGRPSYSHCEATLYLRIAQGNYGAVSLDGMQVATSGGMCAVRQQNLSALYFDPASSRAQQLAFMKLWASFSTEHAADFPHVRVLPIQSEVHEDTFFRIVIPDTLEMEVDRNWGRASPQMPKVAAQDYFSNTLEYAQNIRYRVHDVEAGLDFDYSHRQANYREVDLTVSQYRSRKMLIEFGNGQGWFNPEQMKLIKAQGLTVPELDSIRKKARQLAMEEKR
jgi:hypothetical protein